MNELELGSAQSAVPPVPDKAPEPQVQANFEAIIGVGSVQGNLQCEVVSLNVMDMESRIWSHRLKITPQADAVYEALYDAIVNCSIIDVLKGAEPENPGAALGVPTPQESLPNEFPDDTPTLYIEFTGTAGAVFDGQGWNLEGFQLKQLAIPSVDEESVILKDDEIDAEDLDELEDLQAAMVARADAEAAADDEDEVEEDDTTLWLLAFVTWLSGRNMLVPQDGTDPGMLVQEFYDASQQEEKPDGDDASFPA